MDEYIIRYQDDWVLNRVHSSLDAAREDFVEQVSKYPDEAIQVLKINVSEGTCIDVTGDVVELAYPAWNKDAATDDTMPSVYAKYNMERTPTYDNREHRTYEVNGRVAP